MTKQEAARADYQVPRIRILTPPNTPRRNRNQPTHPPPHLSRPQLYLHQLVSRLLKVKARHDCQVDRAPQVDNICARLICNVVVATRTTTTTTTALAVVVFVAVLV